MLTELKNYDNMSKEVNSLKEELEALKGM
jgi:hypothetical protein